MDKNQIAVYNSFVKSHDFLEDHALDLAAITQLAPLTTNLKTVVDNIGEAMAFAEQDNSGYTIDKNIKLETVISLMLKIGRGATAYYRSVNNELKLTISDFTETELRRMTQARVTNYAHKMYIEILPDAALLVGATLADLTALNVANTALANVLEDPKRAIEISKKWNDKIPGLLDNGRQLRETIDIYMQTFIATDADLYAEWKLSMGIDDAPTHSTPDLVLTITADPSGIGGPTSTNIIYAPLLLTGAAEIKATWISGGEASIAFGVDADSIEPGGELNVGGGSAPRRGTVASMGYDGGTTIFLNAINGTPSATVVKLEFFLED